MADPLANEPPAADIAANGNHPRITPRDRSRAKRCLNCPMCRRARQQQRGLAFWIVKRIERRLCPWCRAYEKVYGHPPHKASGHSPAGSPQCER